MIILNLLPYKVRQELKHRLSAEVLLLGVFLSAAIVFDAIILLTVDAALLDTAYQLKGELQPIEASRDLHPLQMEMSSLIGLDERYVFSARSLSELVKRRPPGVEITAFQLTAEDGGISMKGTAKSIDAVNAMRDDLERSGSFSDTSVSLEDLLADGRVRFTMLTRTALPRL